MLSIALTLPREITMLIIKHCVVIPDKEISQDMGKTRSIEIHPAYPWNILCQHEPWIANIEILRVATWSPRPGYKKNMVLVHSIADCPKSIADAINSGDCEYYAFCKNTFRVKAWNDARCLLIAVTHVSASLQTSGTEYAKRNYDKNVRANLRLQRADPQIFAMIKNLSPGEFILRSYSEKRKQLRLATFPHYEDPGNSQSESSASASD